MRDGGKTMSIFDRKKKDEKKPVVSGYDYSTREARENTVSELFHRAKTAS